MLSPIRKSDELIIHFDVILRGIALSLDQRWYMFQNMGPAPSPRSGHAMASMGPRVFVLGGLGAEFMNPARPEDPTMVHVLDTSSYSILSLPIVCSSYSCLGLSIALYAAPYLQNTSNIQILANPPNRPSRMVRPIPERPRSLPQIRNPTGQAPRVLIMEPDLYHPPSQARIRALSDVQCLRRILRK